jgi:hypothetical protein
MALLLALVLAPDAMHETKLRFEKGMVYEDAANVRVKLRLIQQQGVAKYDIEEDTLFRRTVLAVGDDGLPSEEKVEVVRFKKTIHDQPDVAEPGTKANAAEGKTFLWKRAGESCALLEGDKDVTKDHAALADRLRSYLAKRGPGKPVEVGGTWEVPAAAFLAAAGQKVPPGVEGAATFKLEEVKDGVGRISFEAKSAYRDFGCEVAEVRKGTWLFDVARAREVSFEAEGSIEYNKLEAGDGSFKMTRTLTYR